MRLFIAIQLSEEMKSSIISIMHELKKAGVKGRYVPVRNLHLTLAFLGETDAVGCAQVQEAMKTVSFKSFRLSLSEAGNFGDLLWIGLKGNQGLAGLVRDLRTALDAAGISYDRKKFQPHITIIRKAVGNWRNLKVNPEGMMVKKISLMKSEMKDGQRVYTELFQWQG